MFTYIYVYSMHNSELSKYKYLGLVLLAPAIILRIMECVCDILNINRKIKEIETLKTVYLISES